MVIPVDNEQLLHDQEILQDFADTRGTYVARPVSASDNIDESISREAYERLEWFEFRNRQFFMRWNENFRETMNYLNSHQWNTDQQADFISQGRKPYVFNEIGTFFQAMLGEQITQRTEARVSPKTDISENFAEAMNHYLHWVFQENRYQHTLSGVFRDGVGPGLGVVSTMLDPRNPFEQVKIEQCFPLEFMWDTMTATPEISDSDFIWRGRFTSVGAACDEYPEFKEQIARHAGTLDRYMYAWNTIRKPMVASPANKLWTDSPVNSWSYLNRDMVFMREFYHRRYEHRWVVRDGTTNTEAHFQTQQEAQDFAESTYWFYKQPVIMQNFGVSEPMISEPFERQCPFIDKYVFFGSQLCFRKTYKTETYPYKFYAPTEWHGDLTSKMEHGKGPQRFINRIMAFVDEIASGWKGGVAINRAYLDDSMTDDDIRQYGVQSNPMWIVNKEPESFPLENFVKPIPVQQTGQLAGYLLQALKDNIDKMFGGANAIGLEAFAGQSGKSASELSSRASRQNVPLYDKLRWFSREVAEQAMYYSQSLDPSVQMYVTDEYGDSASTSFLQHQLGTIFQPEDLSFSVDITEQSASQGEREAEYDRLNMLAQTVLPKDPMAIQALMPILLKNSNVDPRDRKQFQQTYAQLSNAQAQAGQDQVEFEREMEMKKLDIELMRLQVKKYEIEQTAQNTTRLMLSGKMEDLNPAEKATYLQKLGMDADPETVLQDMAVGGLFKQQVRDVAQSHFDALTPAWQKAAAKNSAKGVETPKDRKNRDMKKVS